MKLIHISDLHLGKRINEFSMLEDQRYILEQVVKICAAAAGAAVRFRAVRTAADCPKPPLRSAVAPRTG